MGTPILSKNAVDFMTACFDDFTLEELESIDASDPDNTDCQEWGITPDEWIWGLTTALTLKKQSAMEEQE